MYISQSPYRELYERIVEDDEPRVFERILLEWTRRYPDEVARLQAFGARRGDPIPGATDEELCILFALSLVNDTLLLPFQPEGDQGWPGPRISPAEYVAFMEGLGMTVVQRSHFHPFFHEIVGFQRISQSPPPDTVTPLWPCLMLGPLLFSRGGCEIPGDLPWLDSTKLLSSTLFWANQRRHRPTSDLSHGWGSNSRWRTRFRRDYALDGVLHLNVDGKGARQRHAAADSSEPDPLTDAEQAEILLFRSLVHSEKDDRDVWPWDYRLLLLEEMDPNEIVFGSAAPPGQTSVRPTVLPGPWSVVDCARGPSDQEIDEAIAVLRRRRYDA